MRVRGRHARAGTTATTHAHVPLEPLCAALEFCIVRDARAEDGDLSGAFGGVEGLLAEPLDAVDVLLLDVFCLAAVVDVQAGQGGRHGEKYGHLGPRPGRSPVEHELRDSEVDKAGRRVRPHGDESARNRAYALTLIDSRVRRLWRFRQGARRRTGNRRRRCPAGRRRRGWRGRRRRRSRRC